MAAYKYWRAAAMASPTPATLELAEFHLYNGASRVDQAATLTASAAPTGALANLRDGNTGTGCYWSAGGDAVRLQWQFASAQDVDSIMLGARTTVARFPTGLVLQGGPNGTDWPHILWFGGWRFASGAMTARLLPGQDLIVEREVSDFDYITPGGSGRVPFVIQREILSATNPATLVPQWAKVRLYRDCDGRLIRETWSDKMTGEGAFERIDPNYLYTVEAIYPSDGKRAVIADRVKPEGYPA